MKSNLHPTYQQITVKCACGATFMTGSAKSDISVDICSKCHPFFTGEMKFVDTLGRVEKFQAKQQAALGKKGKKQRHSSQSGPRSLHEIRHSQSK